MKRLLFGLIALTTVFGFSWAVQSEIKVEYEAAQTKNNVLPAIKVVRFKERELPHITITDLLNEQQKKIHEKKESERKSWNRFTVAQVAAFFAATAAYSKYYINDDDVVNLRKKISNITWANRTNSNYIKMGIGCSLAALAIYPLIRYFEYFKMHEFTFLFPSEEIDERIAVLRKKIYSHSEMYGDTVVHIYNISDPIGYMTVKEEEKVCKVVSQVNKRMHVSCMNMVLCLGGLAICLGAMR